MKKLSLLSIALLAPIMTFAMFSTGSSFQADSNDKVSVETESEVKMYLPPAELMCAQVIQPAINANGECKEFPTPCEVPEDWKKVSSCENFEKESNIPNIDEVTKRRHQSKWGKLRAKARNTANKKGAKNARAHKFLRKSRSFVKKNRNRAFQDYSKVRGISEKNWTSKFRKFVSPARQKMLDKKDDLQKIKEAARKANKRRKLMGSATMAVRTGKLSNKFWSTAAKSREKRQKRFTRNSDVMKKALRSRQPFRKAHPKPQGLRKHVQLRKIYKGGSFRGSLSGDVK